VNQGHEKQTKNPPFLAGLADCMGSSSRTLLLVPVTFWQGHDMVTAKSIARSQAACFSGSVMVFSTARMTMPAV
jgi:hypothetical protein